MLPTSSGIEFRHLRYFLAVFEELHFGRAAERLHIAQPPLSQAIRKLERELGVQLFVRTSRAVEPTPAGIALAEEARPVLAGFEFALSEARRARQPASRASSAARRCTRGRSRALQDSLGRNFSCLGLTTIGRKLSISVGRVRRS